MRSVSSKRFFANVLFARILAIALLLVVDVACSGKSGDVDKFLGDPSGKDKDPTYSLDFDPSSYDFGPVLITATTPLTKEITVTNKSNTALHITTLTGGAS